MRDPARAGNREGTRSYPSERLVSYTDAIFSIAVTLLVIDIKMPESGESGIFAGLLSAWPSIAAFLVSFCIITVVWFNHHEMFHHIRRVDQGIIVANVLLTLNIVLIPLASSILARSFATAGPDASLGAFLYGIWIAIGGVPFNILWRRALKRPYLLREDVDMTLARRLGRHYAFGPCLYALAAAGAFLCPWLAIGMFILLPVAYFMPVATSRKNRQGRKHSPSSAGERS